MDPDNLPEWAMENPSESGGSFDASGAFHGGGHSDDDEEGPVHPEAAPPHEPAAPPTRSPDDTAAKPPHIAKSQSASALPSPKPPSPVKTQQQNNHVKKSTSATAIPAHNGRYHSNGYPPRKSDEDLDRMQVDADSLVDKLTADEEEKMAAGLEQEKWFYRDPQSEVQGPFGAHEMDEWFRAGYFNVNLLVRRACDERFAPLGDLIKAWGRVPFLVGPYVPPLKNEVSPPTPLVVQKPSMDQESIMQQYQYQQLLHRQAQLGQQQAAFQAVVNKLSQTDRWASLSPAEQQQLVMQHMVEPSVFLPPQQPQKNPVLQQFISQMKPPSSDKPTLPPLHPLQQLIQQMGGGMAHQQMHEAVLKAGPMGHQMHEAGPMGHQQMHDAGPMGHQQMHEAGLKPGPMAHQQIHESGPMGHQQMHEAVLKAGPMGHQQMHEAMLKAGPMGHQQMHEAMLKAGPMGQQQMHEAMLKAGPMGHQQMPEQDQDPIQSLLRQINANKPQMDVWGNPITAPSWMSQLAPAAPPPGQLPMSMWDIQSKDMKTEQQIIEERLQMEEEKRVEEAMKKAEAEEKRRKHKEETMKMKELEKQRLEEERQRLEEARRKVEEEKRMQELQEQKRLEDEMRKREKEEKKRKEEEKKKREEEKKRKEEEKERKRKLEEERKRDEEEKKRLEEEALSRKRLEEEEQVRRVEQQHQAFRRLQERAKAAPWSQQAAQQPTGNSLAEIQRQEKVQKERESREQQLLLQNMQQIHQQQAAVVLQAQQQDKSNLQLKWADRKPHVNKVKSLAEIQAEESKSERDRAERAVKETVVQPSAGIWSAAPQSLSWASTGNAAWNSSQQQVVGGFWDDVPAAPAPRPAAPAPRPAAKPKSAPVQSTPSPAAPKPAPATKSRNKKEEAVVMKLFDNQRGDDFTQWCSTALHNIEANVDIPTFVGFLRDIESPYEVKDYVKMYLGESKESQEFARQFLERRSKWRSAQRGAPQHDDLAQPAPAINPNSTDFQEVKGKAKKMKKNKMCKVDSRILGFSVTAAQDRINVGDRDYGEGV